MDARKRRTINALSGAAIAAAAAGMFLTANIGTAFADEMKVQCTGVNACKGKGECKGAKNACKGENACKGQGHVGMSKADCEKKGGTVMEKK